MRYDWLLDVILALHFGYLAFLVLGGFLAWRWPRVFWVHAAAAVWAVLIVAAWVDCPLTWAENWARRRAGMAPVSGFIDHYLTNVVYPARYLQEVRLAVALVILVSWIGVYVRWRRRRRAKATTGDTTAIDAGRGGRAATV
jgi:hypothetical protein